MATTSAIDPLNGDLRPVAEIAERITGRRPSAVTCFRWRTIGVYGAKLECIPGGKTWLTSPRAFADFLRQQGEARGASRAAS